MEILKRHPVIAYFVLAMVLTWWMFPLLEVSPLLGLFGLFGPALAAITMAAVLSGRSGVWALLKRVVRKSFSKAVGGWSLRVESSSDVTLIETAQTRESPGD